MKLIGRGVLDTPLSRSMTAVGGASAVGKAAGARDCARRLRAHHFKQEVGTARDAR